MKVPLLCAIGFSCLSLNAQYTDLVPWSDHNSRIATHQKIYKEDSGNFNRLVHQFDSYWKSHDPTKKGSGFKPFMRWRNRWENNLTENGNIPSVKYLNTLFANSKNLPEYDVQWSSVGPSDVNNITSNGKGRINIVIEDPNNANIIYAGTPAGGLWKSVDDGANWQALFQNHEQIGVSAIAIDPFNSNTIYIGTGDDDGGDSYSIGIMKSNDGGINWANTGFQFSKSYGSIEDIFIHPENSSIIIAATSEGIFKSTDAGSSWHKKLHAFFESTCRFNPNNPDIIYAIVRGISEIAFYKSIDGGENFTMEGDGLPTGSGTVMVMDVTPANSNVIYVLAGKTNGDPEVSGVYKSNDQGLTFVKKADPEPIYSQCYYDFAIAVSDVNENEVFAGAVFLTKSTDGGETFFRTSNHWGVHVDIHYLKYSNGTLLCGSDGGAYRSFNGVDFDNITGNMQIGQFYRIALPEFGNANYIVGGLQDNGTWGYNGNHWNQFGGGDGTDNVVLPNNTNVYYGTSQFGGFVFKSTDNGQSISSYISRPADSNWWVNPMIVNSSGIIYSSYNSFYRLENDQWQNQTTFFAENTNAIGPRVLEIDPNDENIMYGAINTELYKSTDEGLSWAHICALPNMITAIEVHNNDSAVVYVAISGSSNQIHKSTDGGLNFQDISNDLANTGGIRVIKHQRGTDYIYAGGQFGVYFYNGTQWYNYDSGMPSVTVSDIELNYTNGVIIAATYGRGIWSSNMVTTDCLDSDGDGVCDEEDNCLHTPNADQADINLDGIGDACETSCISITDSNPYNQSFEDSFGEWIHNEDNDLDWRIHSGRTPSWGTGPNNANHGNYYIYVESSSPNYPQKVSKITSPCFDPHNESYEVSFNYHMYGSYMGTLSLQITQDEGGSWETIWTKTGDQGDEWKSTAISLATYSNTLFQLRFVGITGVGYRSDMAIDNFEIGEQDEITALNYMQSFENSFGNWTHDASNYLDWRTNQGTTTSSSTGPSNAYHGESYIYMEASYPNYPNKNAAIISPEFALVGGLYQASFSYHMFGSYMGILKLEISTDQGASWISIWEMAGNQGDVWYHANVSLASFADEQIQLRFNGQTGPGYRSDIAIDNFAIGPLDVVVHNNEPMAIPIEEAQTKENNLDLRLFPNPVKNYLFINLLEENIRKIVIYNLHGQVQLSTKDYFGHEGLYVGDFQKGLFIMHLELKNGEKLIKKFLKG